LQYFTSLGKEHCQEGMLKLLKGRDKYFNANGDWMEK
jgi:hypothetical protein